MGSSPSCSASTEHTPEEGNRRPTSLDVPIHNRVFNPFDSGNFINFPDWSEAVRRGSPSSVHESDREPSIETIATYYPVDLPLRFPQEESETERNDTRVQNEIDRWFSQQSLKKAIKGDSPTPSCIWNIEGLPYRDQEESYAQEVVSDHTSGNEEKNEEKYQIYQEDVQRQRALDNDEGMRLHHQDQVTYVSDDEVMAFSPVLSSQHQHLPASSIPSLDLSSHEQHSTQHLERDYVMSESSHLTEEDEGLIHDSRPGIMLEDNTKKEQAPSSGQEFRVNSSSVEEEVEEEADFESLAPFTERQDSVTSLGENTSGLPQQLMIQQEAETLRGGTRSSGGPSHQEDGEDPTFRVMTSGENADRNETECEPGQSSEEIFISGGKGNEKQDAALLSSPKEDQGVAVLPGPKETFDDDKSDPDIHFDTSMDIPIITQHDLCNDHLPLRSSVGPDYEKPPGPDYEKPPSASNSEQWPSSLSGSLGDFLLPDTSYSGSRDAAAEAKFSSHGPELGKTYVLGSSLLRELVQQCVQLTADTTLAAVTSAAAATSAAIINAAVSSQQIGSTSDKLGGAPVPSRTIGTQTQTPPKDQGMQTDFDQQQSAAEEQQQKYLLLHEPVVSRTQRETEWQHSSQLPYIDGLGFRQDKSMEAAPDSGEYLDSKEPPDVGKPNGDSGHDGINPYHLAPIMAYDDGQQNRHHIITSMNSSPAPKGPPSTISYSPGPMILEGQHGEGPKSLEGRNLPVLPLPGQQILMQRQRHPHHSTSTGEESQQHSLASCKLQLQNKQGGLFSTWRNDISAIDHPTSKRPFSHVQGAALPAPASESRFGARGEDPSRQRPTSASWMHTLPAPSTVQLLPDRLPAPSSWRNGSTESEGWDLSKRQRLSPGSSLKNASQYPLSLVSNIVTSNPALIQYAPPSVSQSLGPRGTKYQEHQCRVGGDMQPPGPGKENCFRPGYLPNDGGVKKFGTWGELETMVSSYDQGLSRVWGATPQEWSKGQVHASIHVPQHLLPPSLQRVSSSRFQREGLLGGVVTPFSEAGSPIAVSSNGSSSPWGMLDHMQE